MKYILTIIILLISNLVFGQYESIEDKYSLAHGTLNANHVIALNELNENEMNFDYISKQLDSDSTDLVIKMIILDTYMHPEYFHNWKFKECLVNNCGLEIDINLYKAATAMRASNKVPILEFLINQDDTDIFPVSTLMESEFMANCDLFKDPYHLMFTCKLLYEFILSTERFNEENYQDSNECAFNNYKKIKNFCTY